MSPALPADPELSDDELMELDRCLASPELIESSLDVFGLEGFCTAVFLTSRQVEPAEWTPWIWDVDRGESAPEFASREEEQRILELVMRLYHSVAQALLPGAGEFEPLFADGDSEAATNWCSGFVAGTRFEAEEWTDRIDERPKWFAPILGLGLEDEAGPPPRQGQIERWTRDVGPAVTKIRAYWPGERQTASDGEAGAGDPAGATPAGARQTAGRNDPCPCGSGRKYKRCCGAPASEVN